MKLTIQINSNLDLNLILIFAHLLTKPAMENNPMHLLITNQTQTNVTKFPMIRNLAIIKLTFGNQTILLQAF
jgi:hypothetical protein